MAHVIYHENQLPHVHDGCAECELQSVVVQTLRVMIYRLESAISDSADAIQSINAESIKRELEAIVGESGDVDADDRGGGDDDP